MFLSSLDFLKKLKLAVTQYIGVFLAFWQATLNKIFSNVYICKCMEICSPCNISELFRKTSTTQLGFCMAYRFSWHLSYLSFSLLHFITQFYISSLIRHTVLCESSQSERVKLIIETWRILNARIHSLFFFNFKIKLGVHWNLHSIPAPAAKLLAWLEELCKIHPTTYLLSLE